MDSTTVRSMIIYTGEMSEDWQDLDILEVASAADTYKLPGWVEKFWTKLRGGELTEVQLEEMRIAEETYDTLAMISAVWCQSMPVPVPVDFNCRDFNFLSC